MTGAGTSQRLTVGGLLTLQFSTATPRLTPPVVELSVTPNIAPLAGAFSPDTTVFLGSIAALPTGSRDHLQERAGQHDRAVRGTGRQRDLQRRPDRVVRHVRDRGGG